MEVDRARFLVLTSAIAAACARSPGIASGGKPPPGEARAGESAEPGVVEVPEAVERDEPEETTPQASGCDDMSGAPARCTDMRLPGPTCEQGMNVSPNVCEGFKQVAKPRIAEALTQCLIDRSKSGGRCGPDDWVGDCPARALDQVCNVQRSFERECNDIVARCSRIRPSSTLTSEQCLRMASAVLPSEQKNAISCVSEGCGVEWCFMSLAYGKL